MAQFQEKGDVLIVTKTNGSKVVYILLKDIFDVSERQLSLPYGQKLEYPDGSKFMHAGEFNKHYALIRNWKVKGQQLPSRIAIPWNNLRRID